MICIYLNIGVHYTLLLLRTIYTTILYRYCLLTIAVVYTLNILHLFDITSFILFYQNNIILPINEIQIHTILTTLFYVSIIHRSRKV